MTKKRQDARLDLRCHEWQKRALEEASGLVGESMSEFAVRAITERIESVYEQANMDPEERLKELGKGAIVLRASAFLSDNG